VLRRLCITSSLRACDGTEKTVSELGIRERHVGGVTILDSDGTLRIRLKFGGSSVPLEKAVESLLAVGRNQILLNLEGVQVISAKGLGELVSSYVVVRDGGGEFKLFNLTPNARQLMSNTRLLNVFDFYESEDQAVASFNQNGFKVKSPATDQNRTAT